MSIDPGLAFGTGTHPSTKLVLAYLERTIRGGERVLDYGCGSGILAIAAAKLGAAHVDGVDVDPQAVETAAANATANGVDLNATLPDALAAADYDLVVSNILAQPLIVLAPLLAARGRRLALSGILDEQAEEVMHAYRPWLRHDARGERRALGAARGRARVEPGHPLSQLAAPRSACSATSSPRARARCAAASAATCSTA